VSLKSKLLTTALVLPTLVVGYQTSASDINTDVTAPVSSSEDAAVDENFDLFSIGEEGAVVIDGPPVGGVAVKIDHGPTIDTEISGRIQILDDGAETDTRYDTSNSVGLQIGDGAAVFGDIDLNATASIFLLDSLALADNDEDFVADGVTRDQDTVDTADDVFDAGAFAQDTGRIGVNFVENLNGNFFADAGSVISVTSNESQTVAFQASVSGFVDLNSTVALRGSDVVGGAPQAAIYFAPSSSMLASVRIGGAVTATGENAHGIYVDGPITGSLQIASRVSTTGFQTTLLSNNGLLAEETILDANELRDSGSAVYISENIGNGLILNGRMNGAVTDAEQTALDSVTSSRSEGTDVSATRTTPFHFDSHRVSGSLIVRGSAPAVEIDGGVVGQVVESFVDKFDDDQDVTSVYHPQTFSYSHSFLNRGSITAYGFNDGYEAIGVRTGTSDVLSTSLPGGFYASGSVLASAYNNDATAIDFANNDADTTVDLGAGGRALGDVFLNEGSITASVTTNVATQPLALPSSFEAVAVKLGAGVDTPDTPGFTNRGSVTATSSHISTTQTIAGDNAIAFDFSAFSASAVNLTQELRRNDEVDGVTGLYIANGDLDLDVAGDTDADGKVIGDGFVTSQDVARPSITGDVKFGSMGGSFMLTSGTVDGNIYFGNALASFGLDNQEADPIAGSSYEKPTTTFRGAIAEAVQLQISVNADSSLMLVDQETIAPNQNVTSLSVTTTGNIGFMVDGGNYTEGTALLRPGVLELTGTDFTISPQLSTIEADSMTVRFLETESDLSSFAATINDRLSGDAPYIYNVALNIEQNVDDGTNDALTATFGVKTADELGLNKTQTPSLDAVLNHFASDATRSAALTSLTTEQGFMSAYDQLLPQYGDGTARQLASLASLASGSVSQQLQLVKAGGRNGGDGWLQQFGDYIKHDATAQSDTLSGDSFSIASGYDAPLFGLDALGMFLQMNFANIDEKNSSFNEVKTEGWSVGAYLAESFGSIGLELVAQTGTVDMESLRVVTVGTLSDVLYADWEGESIAASGKIIVPILRGNHQLQAEFGADYFSLDQDGYSERAASTSGFAMQVGDASSELTTSYIGLRGRQVIKGRSEFDVTWMPTYYVGYQTTNNYDAYEAKAQFVGDGTEFILKNNEDIDDAASIGFGVSAYNDYFAIEFDYRASFGDDVETHGGGLAVRLKF
jgi:hypothetical protein